MRPDKAGRISASNKHWSADQRSQKPARRHIQPAQGDQYACFQLALGGPCGCPRNGRSDFHGKFRTEQIRHQRKRKMWYLQRTVRQAMSSRFRGSFRSRGENHAKPASRCRAWVRSPPWLHGSRVTPARVRWRTLCCEIAGSPQIPLPIPPCIQLVQNLAVVG